jgi:hypothetical protein
MSFYLFVREIGEQDAFFCVCFGLSACALLPEQATERSKHMSFAIGTTEFKYLFTSERTEFNNCLCIALFRPEQQKKQQQANKAV